MLQKKDVGLLVTVILHLLTGFSQGQGVNPSECRSLMDLYVVLDGSDSISYDDFLSLKLAMGSLIPQIDLGPMKARLGMLVYSSHIPVNSEHPFYDNAIELLNAAETLEHPRDGTNTQLGLLHMRQMFQKYGRPNIPWVCVTITDGISKNPQATIAEAKLAEKMGISMIAVGIGQKIDMNELKGIASTERQVIALDNFGQLAGILQSMMTTICPCPSPPVVPYSQCADGPRAIGSIRNYECQTGYLQRGRPDITCLDDSTWTLPDFQCVACDEITPVVQHATCGGGDYTIGSIRAFTCAPGYKTVGNINIECLPDASWSLPQIRCVPCGDTPLVDHATCGGGDYTIGSVRAFTCAPGYKTVGNVNIECLPDASWSLPQIRCVPCGDTPLVDHATCGGGDYTIGSVRAFTCAPGYKTVGNVNIECLPDASWSLPQIRCIPCGDTPIVDHATCGGGDYTIGSVRAFTCAPGYKTVGNVNIECLPDASWSLPQIRCVPCGDTPLVDHATCGGGDYTIGSVRAFTCAPGYKTVGNVNIECLPDASWSLPQIRCVPCGDTPLVDHATCGGGDYTIGSVRAFTCAPGYKTVGNVNIECLPDASWSLPQIRCVPCGDTPLVDHATCGGGDYTIGSVRAFTCAPGYKTVGNVNIECLPDASWSLPQIRCVPCGDTPLVDHATCGGGDYTIGSVRAFTCAPGYKTVGNVNIECLPDASWSLPQIRCVPCGDTPLVDHATCGGGDNIIGSVRAFTCAPGYKTVGNVNIECLPDASWSLPQIRCVPCGDTPLVDHATCGGGDYTIGSVRAFTCAPGYKTVGNVNIECLPDASWSLPQIRCVPCGDTPLVDHATCGGGDYTIGSVRAFTCASGYKTVGNVNIECLPDASWSLPQIRCVPCGDTPLVDHATCGGGDYTIGSVRAFTCAPGYKTVGNVNIECLPDASWSLPQIQCVPCGELPAIPHAIFEGGEYLIGSERIYKCHSGYLPAGGRPFIRCDENAMWTSPEMRCIDCGPTPIVEHGTCGDGTPTLGSRRTFTCAPGYFLKGIPDIMCRDDATWSLPEFTCVPCMTETPVVPNAVCGSGDVLVGSKRTFTCNEGYLPRGNPTIECLANAEWSAPTFSCNDCGAPPVLENGFCGLGPSIIGSTRDFYCEAGFEMVGRGRITCMPDGTWQNPTCSCRRITTTTTTTPAPNIQDPSVCDACRLINGVGYNSHPYDCNQYVQCFIGVNGMEPIYRHCPFGQFWDQNMLTCRPSHLVDCVNDMCFNNPGLMGYRSSDPDSCCSYWKCENGRAYGECCGDGYSFDPHLGQCVYDDRCHTVCPYQDEIFGCDRRPTFDEVSYEQHIGNGFWVKMPCAPGTAYNPVDCACSLVLMTVPGRTRQQVCKPQLYLPFSGSFEDRSGQHVYVHPENVGIVNGSAYFNGQARLLINRFSNTEFSGNLVVKFRYKEILEGPTAASLQALVTNGDCGSDPSIIVAKMPGYVLLGAKTTEPRSFALPTLDKEWKEVIYIHNEKTLEGKVCGATGNKWAYGPIQATHCALQIGYGNGLDNYIGLIDDLYLYQCRPRSSMLTINY